VLPQFQLHNLARPPALAAPVPEPEAYVLMLAGAGLIGWQLRRKLRQDAAQRII
jgi:hypothetical protein